MNLLQVFVLCHIVCRPCCNRTELAGETNDCFAIMCQFKIIGACSGPAPNPSPSASVTALNATEEMCFPQTKLHNDTTVGWMVADGRHTMSFTTLLSAQIAEW